MNFEIVSLEAPIVVVGPALRTAPAVAMAEIGAFWGKFMAAGTLARVPEKLEERVHAVYSEYESDHRGSYTMTLGAPSSVLEPPAGMQRVVVPAGKYARFALRGEPATLVPRAWEYITGAWLPPSPRRYDADFERYVMLSPNDVAVEIFIGLR